MTSPCIDRVTRVLTPFVRSLSACCVVLGVLQGCAKDEPPPPLPAPQPTASAKAPFTLAPQDAGLDAGMKQEGAKPMGTGKKATGEGLENCCAALKQNAESAPEPTKTYMLQAAAQCSALAAAGQGKDGALAIVQRVLRGASLPAGCR